MTILVTTPGGSVGRHVVAALRERPDVRYLAHSERTAASLRDVAGEVVRADATDAGAVRRAVDGVERLYLAHPFEQRQLEAETTVGLAALEAGVRRIVKLSGRAFPGGGSTVIGVNDAIVERLRAVGVPELSVLRPDRFLQNFLLKAEEIAGGALSGPLGDSARGLVDARDIADVAVAELLAERPVGGELEISGPEALTMAQTAERFARALGREVRYVDVPPDEWRAEMERSGFTGWLLDGYADLYDHYRAEGVSGLGDAVQRVLGRPPRSIDDFATELLAPAVAAA